MIDLIFLIFLHSGYYPKPHATMKTSVGGRVCVWTGLTPAECLTCLGYGGPFSNQFPSYVGVNVIFTVKKKKQMVYSEVTS